MTDNSLDSLSMSGTLSFSQHTCKYARQTRE